MSRFVELLHFELRYYLRRLSTWVYLGIMAFMAFMMMITYAGAFPNVTASIGGTDGNVMVNSPHVLLILISSFGLFGILVVAAVAGNAGYRDFGEQMHPMVFTTPTSKAEYVASRYVGSVIVNAVVLTGIAFGLWLGTVMPFIDADLLGPNRLGAYLRPYLLIVLPNVLFASAIFLALALLSRKRMPHYIGGAALLLGYMLSQTLIGDLETKWIAALTDPFGLAPLSLATEYWTTVEKNTQLLGFRAGSWSTGCCGSPSHWPSSRWPYGAFVSVRPSARAASANTIGRPEPAGPPRPRSSRGESSPPRGSRSRQRLAPSASVPPGPSCAA